MADIEKNCCSVADTVLQNVVIHNGISAGYTDIDADTKRFNMLCDNGYIPKPKLFVGALDSNCNHYRFTEKTIDK